MNKPNKMLIMSNPFFYDSGSDVFDNIYSKIASHYPFYAIEGFSTFTISIQNMTWERFKDFKQNNKHESRDCHYLYFAVGDNMCAYMYNIAAQFWDVPQNYYKAYRENNYPSPRFTNGVSMANLVGEKARNEMIDKFISDAIALSEETIMGQRFEFSPEMYEREIFEENGLDYDKFLQWKIDNRPIISPDFFTKK